MRKILWIAVVVLTLLPSLSRAEDINAIFKKVNDLVAAKNYTKALEELTWAQKEIEKLNVTHMQSFFPDALAGYTGAKFEANSALGMTNLERQYTKPGSSERVKVSLSGSSSGGATGGLGGLAAFGRMAAMMGGNQGQDTFRIAGRTATLQKEEGSSSAQLTVFLDSGSILSLELTDGSDASVLKTMAEALKINDLDAYLRGQS